MFIILSIYFILFVLRGAGRNGSCLGHFPSVSCHNVPTYATVLLSFVVYENKCIDG